MLIAEGIDREEIRSSSIASIGYADATQTLAVGFTSGDIYHYRGVPFSELTNFYAAESRGRYFAQHIRGKYHADKMTGDCLRCGAKGLLGEQCDDCGCADFVRVDKRQRVPSDVEAELARLAPIDPRD